MKVQPHIKAALLYLLLAVAVFAIWLVLLFIGSKQQSSAMNTFTSFITEGPQPMWFRWLLTLPICSLALAACYASRWARSYYGSRVLLGIGIVLAICAWFTVSTEVAVLASLPVLFGFLAAKQAAQSKGKNAA